jgi:hypothetical protein
MAAGTGGDSAASPLLLKCIAMPSPANRPRHTHTVAASAIALLIAACASTDPAETVGPPRKEVLWAVTDAGELIRFNAGQPQRVLERKALAGLPAGESLVGIDYRVAKGVLYGVTTGGRLVTIDTAAGRASTVGSASPAALSGQRFGVDFNPVADRVRVVSDTGMNLRLHPDTGAVAATDPALQYTAGDARGGQPAGVTAAGYTYNKTNDKLTTNYAIDIRAGTLVVQGSREGTEPVVSPNSGQLRTVGSLGVANIEDASLDLSDLNNTALAALKTGGRTRLYLVDLASGKARLIGSVAGSAGLRGMAIEP